MSSMWKLFVDKHTGRVIGLFSQLERVGRLRSLEESGAKKRAGTDKHSNQSQKRALDPPCCWLYHQYMVAKSGDISFPHIPYHLTQRRAVSAASAALGLGLWALGWPLPRGEEGAAQEPAVQQPRVGVRARLLSRHLPEPGQQRIHLLCNSAYIMLLSITYKYQH